MVSKSVTIITQDTAMQALLAKVDRIVDSDGSVLLIGETGVGKELFAEYIHRSGPRCTQPFVKVGLAALPADLIESELFGYEKGAFTNAANEKKGLFELANGGSIFLDDIDDFPIGLQAKLLRVLESRELMRIGGQVSIPINIRLITASKLNLKDLVEQGRFRADLFYRINVVPLIIPPLRNRVADIPLLAEYYLEKFAPVKKLVFKKDALQQLVTYSWPGNVRELRNVIQQISLFAMGTITPQDIPLEINGENPISVMTKACQRCLTTDHMSLHEVVDCLELNLIKQALQETDGNKSNAAKKLGVNFSTFRDKLRKFGLE